MCVNISAIKIQTIGPISMKFGTGPGNSFYVGLNKIQPLLTKPELPGTSASKYIRNTKGVSITVPLTSCLTGLESTV